MKMITTFSSYRARTFPCVLALLFALPSTAQAIVTNPDLVPACGMDIVLVLDESGSIYDSGDVNHVRLAAHALAEALVGTESRLAITEFSGYGGHNELRYPDERISATPVPFTLATATSLFNTFDPYLFDHVANGYNPLPECARWNWSHSKCLERNLFRYTDWEAGAIEVRDLNDKLSSGNDPDARKPFAPLVIYMTDGDPNRYINYRENREEHTTHDEAGWSIAAPQAARVTDQIKQQGSHILVLGTGNALSDPHSTSAKRLELLSGPDVVTHIDNLNISTTDVALIDFNELAHALQEIVFGLCENSVTITKLGDPDGTDGLTPPETVRDWKFTGHNIVAEGPCTHSDGYEWITPNPGLASSIGMTQDGFTDEDGEVKFHWKPGSIKNPHKCESIFTFNEDYGDSDNGTYRFRRVDCTRTILNSDGTITKQNFSPPMYPGPIDADHQKVDAVIYLEDSQYVKCTVINDDENSTPVTLGRFHATPGGSGVDFAWQTVTETANNGFNLYVEDADGEWQRINDETIPPAEPGDSLSVRHYSYQASGIDGKRFKLGNIDTYNTETRHGPFELDKPRGVDRAGRSKTNWKAIRAENKEKDNIRKQQRQLKSQARIKLQLDRKLDAEEKRAKRQNR